MMDINDHHLYTDKLTIGMVDLTNIDLATDEDKRYNVDKWAKFFKAKTWEELEMITLEYPEISDSASYVHEISAEEHFRQQCAAREDAIRRENTLKFGLEEANKKLAEQDEIMAEQNKIIAERDETIAECNTEIANLVEENARLKAELAKLQK